VRFVDAAGMNADSEIDWSGCAAVRLCSCAAVCSYLRNGDVAVSGLDEGLEVGENCDLLILAGICRNTES